MPTDVQFKYELRKHLTELERKLELLRNESNGGVENKELDYQIKVTLAKLSSLGISVEDITL